MTHEIDATSELLVAADHGRVSGEIGRWLVHDIRGPLQGVTLTLALLSEPDAAGFDESLREALTTAASEFNGVVAQFDRLLRPPKLAAEAGPVPLSGVLDEAERFLARRRVRVDLAWPSADIVAALPPVHAAADNLLHVMLSLLLRGLAAARAGGRVDVGAVRSGTAVEISISALPAEDQAPGAGSPADLATAASSALLERLGGSLAAASDGGRSTLTVRLPEFGRSS